MGTLFGLESGRPALNNPVMRPICTCILLLTFVLAGCATNPVTGKQDFALISEAKEIEQGRKFHRHIIARYGVYDDPELQQYVDEIGQGLARNSHRGHLEFTFTVLDSPEINAFALPGGYIYITRGIMAYLDSEAELAGVLGHEIGHVTARHSVRQQAGQFASDLLTVLIGATTGSDALSRIGQTLGTGIVRGYGREHELEADRLGAQYLHRSGYDPENMLGVIGVLKDQEVYERKLAQKENRQASVYHGVFSTHPRNDDRLKTVVRAARKLSASEYRDDNQRLYRDLIDGMLWGPSLKQGIVVSNRFAHPGLAIALQFPSGWKVVNNPDFLMARQLQTGALIQVTLENRAKDESPSALLKRITRNNDLRVNSGDYGVTARVEVRPPNGKDKQPARLTAIALDKVRTLVLLATAGKQHFANADKRFIEVNQSFKRLSESEVEAIEVPRLRLVPAGSVSSFAGLAEQSALEYDAENRLRLLNRAFPAGEIEPGTRLKTIAVYE